MERPMGMKQTASNNNPAKDYCQFVLSVSASNPIASSRTRRKRMVDSSKLKDKSRAAKADGERDHKEGAADPLLP